MSWISTGAMAVTAGVKVGQGISQRRKAKRLKESTFVPAELLMNKELAQQQAYSRRAPGAAQAEEQIRRNQSNQTANALKMSGGDANKAAAISSAANAQANDANARVQTAGQQFAENAFGRVAGANTQIAGQKRQNRDEFTQTKAALLDAGNKNIFNGISDAASTAIATNAAGAFDGAGAEARGEAKALRAVGFTSVARQRLKEGRQANRAAASSSMGSLYMRNNYGYGGGGYYGGGRDPDWEEFQKWKKNKT